MKIAVKLFMLIYRVLAAVIVAAAVLIGVFYLFGIRPYAVITGSMEPAIHKGSLCFINHNTPFEEIKPGQVIAFKAGNLLVTHRAVRISSDGIVTRGDANNSDDDARVTKENYIGKNETVVPYLGFIPMYMRTFRGKCIVIGGFAAFLLIGLLYDKISVKLIKEENEEAVQNGNEKGGQKE